MTVIHYCGRKNMQVLLTILLNYFLVLHAYRMQKNAFRSPRSLVLQAVATAQQSSPPAIHLSPMVTGMAFSKTIEIHGLTKELENSGKEVFSLCVGEPDYQPPKAVIEATAKAAASGHTKYTAVNGDAKLRKAIANDLKVRKHLTYTPEQIVVANGAKQSVLQALLSVVSPGDKVLIPAPYWTSYPDMVKMCQGESVFISTKAEDDYILKPDDLRAALQTHGESVKAIILCNPSNPTGSVASKEEQEALVKVLLDFPQVIVISDEIYERLVYDNVEHVSFASLDPQIFHRTVTINGFSKSHAMTGYRLGYSASNTQIAKAMGKIQSQITSCASSVGQEAAYTALTVKKEEEDVEAWMIDRVQELQEKRNLCKKLLEKIPNISCPTPRGAFYLFPDVSAYYNKKTIDGKVLHNGHELCMELLKAEGVALVPGEAFGAERAIRISYATSTEVIEESMRRLKKFLLSLQ